LRAQNDIGFIFQNGSMRLDRNVRQRAINLLKSTSIRPLIAAHAKKFHQR
jgi:hypothetical protein